MSPAPIPSLRIVRLTCMVAALGGCAAVGPEYAPPVTALPDAWIQRAGQEGARAEDLSRWWDGLGDPLLSGLILQALSEGPELKSAQARLREARARRQLADANRFPSLTASASASRSQGSEETGSGATRDLYSAGFDASWEPDVFGGVRRGIEAADADLQASQASLHATQVSLAAEVALNYVELRASQGRLAIARANLANQAETLRLTEWRAQAGLVSSLDVDQARASLEQTRAQIPELESGLVQAQHRLAVLTGRAPGSLAALLDAPGDIPTVPDAVAVGIPADTLRQRPDVRAAERRLAAETARIGVAEARRYPSLALSGSLGLEALSLGDLTGGNALSGSLLARLAGTIFDAGRLRQQVQIQTALQEQALVAYQSSVLTALEDVENALVALAGSRTRQAALRLAVEAARDAERLARQRYAAGLVDFQTVLGSQRTLLSIEDSLKLSEASAATALIQLYKAMGGGWAAEPTPPQPSEEPS